MATPYLVGLVIQYPSGTALANVQVTLRVESTNESHTETTNSSGEVNFNLGNSNHYPSGYQIGDIFTYYVLYQGYEIYASHTIAATGGYSTTVVLTAKITSPSLKLFTVQDFLDFYDVKIYEEDSENGVKTQQIIKIGTMVEQMIESDANAIFDSNSGSYYSQTEYIDTDSYMDIYHVSKLPVSSVTNLYTTANDEETTPDYTNNTGEWTSLTENTDFFIDKGDSGTGRVMITNSSYQPISRKRGLYVVYKYGRSSVPDDIKLLAIIETGMKLMKAAFLKGKIKNFNDSGMGDISSFETFRKKTIGKYKTDGLNSLNT